MYASVHACVCVCVCVCTYVCMRVCTCVCVCVHVACVLACVHMCVCVCMYICTAFKHKCTSPICTQFQAAVSKLGNSFMLLCPGVMPLRHFLHREAQNCGLQLDPYFYQYVDINTEFTRGFPDTQRPSTLEEMCACILLLRTFGLY